MNNIEVVSSSKLSKEDTLKVEAFLNKLHGKDYTVQYVIETGILGGIIIRDGDKVYDGSVMTQLKKIKQRLDQV